MSKSKFPLAAVIISISMIFLLIGIRSATGSYGPIFWLSLIFGVLIAITAWQTSGTSRPAATAPFFIILLLLTVFASPDEFGQATFGSRFPMVQEAVTNAIAPLALQFGGVTETYQTGFNCIVDPVGCQRQFTPGTQAEGSVMAIEATGFDMAGPTEIQYVCEERAAFFTIRNFADRTAKDVLITPFTPVNIDQSNEEAGDFEIISCGKGTKSEDGKSCLVSELFQGESIQIGINYQIDVSDHPDVRGNRVQLRAGLEYTFDVNGTLDVVVARSDHYDFLASQGRLARQIVSTRDTGGPVRIGIGVFNNEMPIRGGIDATPLLLTIRDQGNGYIKGFDIVDVDASGLTPDGGQSECGVITPKANSQIDPEKDKELSSQPQNIRVTCTVPLIDPESETTTRGVTAFARYDYAIERWQNVFVSFGAGDYCECGDGSTLAGNDEEGGDLSCDQYCSSRGGVTGCFS